MQNITYIPNDRDPFFCFRLPQNRTTTIGAYCPGFLWGGACFSSQNGSEAVVRHQPKMHFIFYWW